MEGIIHFFRDTLSGFNYFVYVLILLFLIFAIIGYMVTDKYRSKNNLSWNFAQNVIYYLFYHNISDEKAKKSYDFFIDNGETFDSYFALNYNKDNIKEFMDMLMNKIFQEMELNKREIK